MTIHRLHNYVENPKESMDNLLELICEFSNIIEYRANI